MDLVESVLRAANAEECIETFKNNNIEVEVLPVLSDNDLQIIGVENSDVRKAILNKSSTLQIPHEKKQDLTITREYTELVLNQISHQLLFHNASLTCALNRKDIVLCDVKLHQASQCLLRCINSLEKELDKFDKKFGVPRRRNVKKKKMYVALGVSVVALFVMGGLAINYILK